MNTSRIARYQDSFYELTNENFWQKMINPPNFKTKPMIEEVDIEGFDKKRKILTFKDSKLIFDMEKMVLRDVLSKDYIFSRSNMKFIDNVNELRTFRNQYINRLSTTCGNSANQICGTITDIIDGKKSKLVLIFDDANKPLLITFYKIFEDNAVKVKFINGAPIIESSKKFPLCIFCENNNNDIVAYQKFALEAKLPMCIFLKNNIAEAVARDMIYFTYNNLTIPELTIPEKDLFFNCFIRMKLKSKKDN